MADTTNDFEMRVRANIAYIWTFAAILLVAYTLYMYGHILAVLTLLIGYYTGVTNNVNGVYFGAPIAAPKKPDNTTPVVTGDNTQVNVVNPTPPAPTT